MSSSLWQAGARDPRGAGPRVLLVRLSAIGDVVMATPLAAAVRRTWPQAYLAWLVEPPADALLRHNPAIDEVIGWPRREWVALARRGRFVALARQASALRRRLRERRFDLAIDLQGLLKSGAWVWLSGAPERVGLGSREGTRRLMSRTVERSGPPGRISREYLHLAQALGLQTDGFTMDVRAGAQEAATARALVAQAGLRRPYAALCPFTTRPQKHWLDERWASLAPELGRRFGLDCVVLGGAAERDRAQALAAAAGAGTASLAGRTPLGVTAAVLQGARLVIGVDTGLTHLGIALGVPTVALFGSTCPYLDPVSPRARVLYHALPCSPCRRRPTCNARYDCMRAHTVAAALEAASDVLAVGP